MPRNHRNLKCLIILWTAVIASATPSAVEAGINQWTELGPMAEDIFDILIDPLEPSVIHLGSMTGVWRSADGGRSWELLSDLSAEILARSHQDHDTLFAAVGDGVYKSTDGGRSWTGPSNPMTEPPGFQWISDLVVDPRDGETVIVTGMSGRALGMSPYVDITHDGGETWTRRDGPGLEAEEIVIDPQTPATLYFAGLGIWRSTDGGVTWEESLDGVASEIDYRSIRQLAISHSDPRVLYGSATVDPFIPVGLWKSTDGGDTWISPSTALDGYRVHDLVVAPDDPDIVYAATTPLPGQGGPDAVRVSYDGGVSWEILGADLAPSVRSLKVNPLFPRHLYAGTDGAGVYKLTRSLAEGCVYDEALCLNDERFHVEVAWEDFEQRRGFGKAARVTDDTGYLWFFNPNTVEVMVKVLDGRAENDHFWVFSGALSNVGYTLQITDTLEERVRTYRNPPERFASFGDVTAFPAVIEVPQVVPEPVVELPQASAIFGCILEPDVLCLGTRYEVSVSWRDFEGNTGTGVPVLLTGDSGYFWFFDPDNVELVVKVVYGQDINDHTWFFYGSLSNVEFTITVSDYYSDEVRTYFNPGGTFASVGDIEALP